MTEQQQNEAQSDAVRTLPHCGNPDLDHLVDEIQHPETEEALYLMASRSRVVE